MPDDHRAQIRELTAAGLDRYANQLARCLKALGTTAPIRAEVQRELMMVRAEQDTRGGTSSPGHLPREYDPRGLTAGQLERTRRELAASLALARPDSLVCAPIQAHIAAIDAELAGRTAGERDELPASRGPDQRQG